MTSMDEALKEQTVELFREAREQIGHCVEQLDSKQLWWRPRPEMNSIGNLLLHLAGNVGQWLVAGVGGAEDRRHRPAEFAAREAIPAEHLLEQLDEMLAAACRAIRALEPDEWLQPRRIQGFDCSTLRAVLHAATHFHGHAQEIVSMTRQQLGESYRFAWQPSTPEEGAEG